MNPVGASRVLNKARDLDKYKLLATKLARESEQNVELMIADFFCTFHKFVNKYSKEIQSNPQLFDKINSICKNLDIEIDYSNKKHRKGENVIEGIGEKIVQICVATKKQNGGLLDVEHCLKILRLRYPQITKKNVIESVEDLSILGTIELIKIGHRSVISTKHQISDDENHCLSLINSGKMFSGVTINDLMSSLGWNLERCKMCLESLVAKGVVWIDNPLESFNPLFDIFSKCSFADAEYVDKIAFYTLF